MLTPKNARKLLILSRIGQLLLNIVTGLILISAMSGEFRYGSYAGVRWLAFTTFRFNAVSAIKLNHKAAMCLWPLLAVVFNPYFPIHLQHTMWYVIDFLVVLLLAGYSVVIVGLG